MEKHLGIVSSCLPHPEVENIAKIKAAGFDTVFTGIFPIKGACELKNECDKQGVTLETIHAPFFVVDNGRFYNTNNFWKLGPSYYHLFRHSITSIDAAAEAGIPVIVHHVSGGRGVADPYNDLGAERFDALVERCIQKGVKIAFENLQDVGNLAALMERYEKVEEVGFCYDCGHEHCYTVTVPFLDLFGNRLLCTHIPENFAKDKDDPKNDTDIHVLPFDGDIDYKAMMDRYHKYGCTAPLTLEVGKGAKYDGLTEEEFLATAYERIKKISEM